MTTKNLIQKALEQIIPSEIIRNWFLEEAIYHKDPLGYGVPLDNDGTVMKFTPMTDSNLGFIRHRLQGVEITVENGIEAIAYTQISCEDLERITRLLYLRVIEETAPKVQDIDGVQQTSLWAVFENPEQYVKWVMFWGEPSTDLIPLFIHASQGLNICLAHNSYQIPMIPDDVSVVNAITYYITWKFMQRMYFSGREGYAEKMQYAEKQWGWYCKQSVNKTMMPHGVDEHQNLLEERYKMLPDRNAYYKYFGKIGKS